MNAQLLALIHDLPMAALRLLAWLAVAALIFMPLEALRGGREAPVPRLPWAGDAAWYFASGLLPAFVLLFTTLPVNALAQAILPDWWLAAIAAWPRWLAVLVTLVVGDFAYYWAHRWSHELPWLWRFHRVHHEPEQVYWLVNTRVHPIDAAYTRSLVFIPVCLLGLTQARPGEGDWVALGSVLFNRVWSTFVHADLHWHLQGLQRWISTPRFHHWHHADEGLPGAGRNYAALLPLWDRCFGTELREQRYPRRYGIAATPATAGAQAEARPLA